MASASAWRSPIQQVGSPREIYEHPVNALVMGFVGAVNRLDDTFVRPHDIELRAEPNGITSPATVERLVHLGFGVRVELEREDGERLHAQVTREQADALGLEAGASIFVRPTNARVFTQAGAGI